MLSSFIHRIHLSRKLLRGFPGKGCLAHHGHTWLGNRASEWNPHPDSFLRPALALGSSKRSIWTPAGPVRAGRSDNSPTQAAVQRSEQGGASPSVAQKGKRGARLHQPCKNEQIQIPKFFSVSRGYPPCINTCLHIMFSTHILLGISVRLIWDILQYSIWPRPNTSPAKSLNTGGGDKNAV